MINGVYAEGEITMDGIVHDQGARPDHVLSRKGYIDILQMGSVGWRKVYGIHIWKYRYEGRRDRDEECGVQDLNVDIILVIEPSRSLLQCYDGHPNIPRPIPSALSVLNRPIPCEYVVGLCFRKASIRIVDMPDRSMINHPASTCTGHTPLFWAKSTYSYLLTAY